MLAKSPGEARLRQASFEKLLLSHGNLLVRLKYIDERSLDTDLQRDIHKELENSVSALGQSLNAAQIDDEVGWIEVYKIEQQIGQLLSGERLKQEIEARLNETQGISGAKELRSEYEKLEQRISLTEGQVPTATHEPSQGASRDLEYPAVGGQGDRSERHARAVTPSFEAETVRRDFLRRILEYYQWYNRTQYLARPIYMQTTRDILRLILLAMVLVIIPYISAVFYGRDFIASFLLPARTWEIVPLYTSLTFGFLGACFSRLMMLQRNWNMSLDEALLQKEESYMWLRAAVGTCGALIVFFLLQAQIVQGAIFPKPNELSIVTVDTGSVVVPTVLVPSAGLALLMVWSFIAGFSEALVPSILTGTEMRLSNAATAERK